jgi:hypothetical protein
MKIFKIEKPEAVINICFVKAEKMMFLSFGSRNLISRQTFFPPKF